MKLFLKKFLPIILLNLVNFFTLTILKIHWEWDCGRIKAGKWNLPQLQDRPYRQPSSYPVGFIKHIEKMLHH